MRKIHFYCDRCGREIHELMFQYMTANFDLKESAEDPICVDAGAELCVECYESINTMVAAAIQNNQAASKKGTPNNLRGGRRLNLDMGKIGALYRAGWKIKDIASEMHVSDVTISKRLEEALKLYDEKLTEKNDREEEDDE